VNASISHVSSETTRRLRELNEARVAQRVRQSQVMRLSALSRPVDQDTTYFVTDRHVASGRDNIVDNQESFEKKYIKIMKSGELLKLEVRLAEASVGVTTSFNSLEEKLSAEKSTGGNSAFTSSSGRFKKATALLSNLEKLELQNFYLVKEYLKLRLNIMTAQREEAEAREDLEKCRETYMETEGELKRQLTIGINSTKGRYDKEMKLLQHQLDRQLIAIAEKAQDVQHAKEQLRKSSTTEEEGLQNSVKLLATRYVLCRM
jgi:hypothetical protein